MMNPSQASFSDLESGDLDVQSGSSIKKLPLDPDRRAVSFSVQKGYHFISEIVTFVKRLLNPWLKQPWLGVAEITQGLWKHLKCIAGIERVNGVLQKKISSLVPALAIKLPLVNDGPITGPTMGVKSTFNGQVGLSALTAQGDCIFPFDSAVVCVRDRTSAGVGAGHHQAAGGRVSSTCVGEASSSASRNHKKRTTDQNLGSFLVATPINVGYTGVASKDDICPPMLLTINRHSMNVLGVRLYNPNNGEVYFVDNFPLTPYDRILDSSGKYVMLYDEEFYRISLCDLVRGQRRNLPQLPHENLGIKIKAGVIEAADEGSFNITLLGTISDYNFDEEREMVVFWKWFVEEENWAVRFDNSYSLQNLKPRTMAAYRGRIWVATEMGEVLMSRDQMPSFQAVPTWPSHPEGVEADRQRDMEIPPLPPYLLPRGGLGPDHSFAAFIHHGDHLFLCTTRANYVLNWDTEDEQNLGFFQLEDIGGATFYAQNESQGVACFSTRGELTNTILITSAAYMGFDRPAGFDCVAQNVVTKDLSPLLQCSPGPCVCQHCWIQIRGD